MFYFSVLSLSIYLSLSLSLSLKSDFYNHQQYYSTTICKSNRISIFSRSYFLSLSLSLHPSIYLIYLILNNNNNDEI